VAGQGAARQGSEKDKIMGFKLTNAEMDLFFKYSEGNLAILFMLIAIRCTEQGGPGKEMGILDKRCKTLEAQVRWARNTVINNMSRFGNKHLGEDPIDYKNHLFSDKYLEYFSGVYAPVGAKNDPTGLNKNHLKNLRYFYSKCRIMLGEVGG